MFLALEPGRHPQTTPQYSRSEEYASTHYRPDSSFISIDYAVMEKAKDVVVMEVDFTWDDVGSWFAIERWNKKDNLGNTVLGMHYGIDTSSYTIVNNEQHLIATIGVSDMIIVHTKDATLICNKQKATQIKKLVEELRQAGHQFYL